MRLKDRIVGFERLDPSVIRPNPKNWRTHPTKQRDALKGVLADVGIVDAVLVRKLDDGTYRLVDGHLRAEEITKQPVPALIVDLNDREEAEVLATFDPVGDLAGTDADAFRSLLQDFNSTNAAVQELVAGLDSQAKPIDIDDAFDALPDGEREPFQQMTFTVHDDQAAIVTNALNLAKKAGVGHPTNKNGNGNAIATICEAYIERR